MRALSGCRRTVHGALGAPSGVEHLPGHGPDIVEEAEGLLCLGRINGARIDEEPQVGVDLPRRAEGDAPVVHPIPADSTPTLCEIGGNRAR